MQNYYINKLVKLAVSAPPIEPPRAVPVKIWGAEPSAKSEPEKNTGGKNNILPILAVVGLIALAALTSAAALSNQSLRLDEAQSLWQASHTTSDIFTIVASDVHVPLYHLALHFWQVLFGNQVATARMLSLFFYLATIPIIYLLGKELYSRKIALFAASLMALSPFLNWYGNEIRMYSMLTFITVLNQYFFVRLMKSRNPSPLTWRAYAITAVLGALVHYFFMLALLAQGIFALLSKSSFKPGSVRNFLIVAGLVALTLASWLLYVFYLGEIKNSEPLLYPPTLINLFSTYSQFMFGFQDDRINSFILSLWPISILLAFLTLGKKLKFGEETFYLVAASFIPVFGAFLISFFVKPIYLSRYLILAVPSLYLALGWILTIYSNRVATVLKAVLIGGMVLAFMNQVVSADTPVKEDFKSVTYFLNRNASPSDVVIASAPFIIYPLDYYYHSPAPMFTLPLWDRYRTGPIPPFNEKELPSEVASLTGDYQNVWLILSYDQGYESKVKEYFDTHFERIYAKTYSPDLNLYEYKLKYNQPDYYTVLNSITKQYQNAEPPAPKPGTDLTSL